MHNYALINVTHQCSGGFDQMPMLIQWHLIKFLTIAQEGAVGRYVGKCIIYIIIVMVQYRS